MTFNKDDLKAEPLRGREKMQKNIIIACQTLYDEVNLTIKETRCNYPVIWVESDYHIDPLQLRSRLQKEIDSLKGFDNIIFVYGCCGNAIVDLTASTANLIFPKTDDCISMLLCKPGEKFQRLKATYFLTKGWIESPKGLMMEHKNALKRYGEKMTKKIFQFMLKNYNKLMLIDTGAYNLEDCWEEAKRIAEITHLKLIVEKGDLWLIKKLLTGPYDNNEFIFIRKGDKVNITHFGYCHEKPVQQEIKIY